jgi:hypothetical protein
MPKANPQNARSPKRYQKHHDGNIPPKEVAETVDVCCGEGLQEEEFALRGKMGESERNLQDNPHADDDAYELSIFGDEGTWMDCGMSLRNRMRNLKKS